MSYWEIVKKVISKSDVLLLVLDARLIEETRNPEIEAKVKEVKKTLIYVITKCDLVKHGTLDHYKTTLNPCVFISATEHFGINLLREKIIIESARAHMGKKSVTVGVLGYPNVGKSSLINAMKGRKSAPTSNMSGYTKGIMKVRIDNRIMLIDTPGVIPYLEKDELKHIITGTVDYTKAKDPDIMVMKFMDEYPGSIELHYGVEVEEDKEESLKRIAIKKNLVKKGADPDVERAARMILRDWQTGRIVKQFVE